MFSAVPGSSSDPSITTASQFTIDCPSSRRPISWLRLALTDGGGGHGADVATELDIAKPSDPVGQPGTLSERSQPSGLTEVPPAK